MNVTNCLYVVMPAYNEAENIEGVVKEWYSVLECGDENSRLVVADSGSTDETHELLVALQKKLPGLVILENTGKLHGPKLLALYKFAIDNGATWIFQTDSDGQTSPQEFSEFWNNREGKDAVLGYRPSRGDGKFRAFVEKCVCFLLFLFFGIKVRDANAPYRLMSSSLVAKYIDRFDNNYNIPNIMLTAFFVKYDEKVCFLPISFKSRRAGENSINLRKIIKIGYRALFDFAEFRRGMK